MNPGCRDVISNWLDTLDANTIRTMGSFLLRLVYTESGDEKRVGGNVGLKMMLQLLIERRPGVFAKAIEPHLRDKWRMVGKPLQNWMWILAQATNVKNVHPSVGVRAWSSLFVDALVSKSSKKSSQSKAQIVKFMQQELKKMWASHRDDEMAFELNNWRVELTMFRTDATQCNAIARSRARSLVFMKATQRLQFR